MTRKAKRVKKVTKRQAKAWGKKFEAAANHPEPTQKQRHDYVQKSLKIIGRNVNEIVRLAFILGRDSIKQEIKAKF